MPVVTVHKFVKIGNFCILNTNYSIDHETEIGDGVHIMGSAAIAGQVTIGNFATIGTNATLFPKIVIGEGSIIGAGSVVTRDVPPYSVFVGSPARFIRKCESQYFQDDFCMLESI